MDASWTNTLVGVLSLLSVLLGALIAKYLSVTKELSDFKTHVAENYATKDEVKDVIERVERQIEIGFNRIYEILNKRDAP